MIRNTTRNQKLGWILFVMYLFAVTYLMFFSEMKERGYMVKEEYTYNLVPFREIKRYIFYAEQIGWKGVLINLAGNIIGFLPCGFFLPVISQRCRKHWYHTVICAYLFSYCIEMAQLFLRAGSCDVDDIILNTLGGTAGYLLFRAVQKFRIVNRKRKKRYGEKKAL